MNIRYSYIYGPNFLATGSGGNQGGMYVHAGVFRVTMSQVVEILGTLTVTSDAEIQLDFGATLLVSP